jgi:hypothetical protein
MVWEISTHYAKEAVDYAKEEILMYSTARVSN